MCDMIYRAIWEEGNDMVKQKKTECAAVHLQQGILEKMADFLIKNANPSIVFHVKNDILKHITEEEKAALQERVMGEKIIQGIIACQKENGWLGNGFHGQNKEAGPYENQEVGVKYLGEKLIYRDTPVLKKAIEAFRTVKSDLFGSGDTDCDQYAATGSDIIMAACVARAGYEQSFDISKEIEVSLASFRRVTEVDSVTDIVRIRKRRPERVNPQGVAYVFPKQEKWPCRYHLDILAHTESWRSEENIAMLAAAFRKLLQDNGLDYSPAYCVDIGHLVGCCGAFREGMALAGEKNGTHQVYLDLVEYMCRCGLYKLVPELQEEVDRIYDSIDEQGICRVDFCENTLKGMGTYSGGQLEEDWKSKTRKLCDVTYRAMVILYHAGRI